MNYVLNARPQGTDCLIMAQLAHLVRPFVFRIHLLKVGLTHNQKTVTLQNLTTVYLLYLSYVRTPHEKKYIGIALILVEVQSHMIAHYT